MFQSTHLDWLSAVSQPPLALHWPSYLGQPFNVYESVSNSREKVIFNFSVILHVVTPYKWLYFIWSTLESQCKLIVIKSSINEFSFHSANFIAFFIPMVSVIKREICCKWFYCDNKNWQHNWLTDCELLILSWSISYLFPSVVATRLELSAIFDVWHCHASQLILVIYYL